MYKHVPYCSKLDNILIALEILSEYTEIFSSPNIDRFIPYREVDEMIEEIINDNK